MRGAEAVQNISLAAGGLCPPEAVGNLGFMVPQTSKILSKNRSILPLIMVK